MLTLRHVPHNNIPLAENRDEVIKHLRRLWGFGVKLESLDADGNVTNIGECAA
jgi:spore cortex formation protein SpoVR/YcgB (stage V sporulation)